MLSVNRINQTEFKYINQNNNLPFKSKFVPNKALSDTFDMAIYNYPYNSTYFAKRFANTIEFLLNDGKNDLIEVTKSRNNGSALKINGKKVAYKSGDAAQLFNIIEYNWKNPNLIGYGKELTYQEFNVLKSAINKLNADLNVDDVTKNTEILNNLDKNIAKIDEILDKYVKDTLIRLRKQIFNRSKNI